MLRIMLCALLCAALAAPAFGQNDPTKSYGTSNPTPTVRKPAMPTALSRPRVTADVRLGDRAPDFELEDAAGNKVRLGSLRGQWVALFFVGRREALAPLDSVQRQLAPRGVRVVAVCSEKAHSLKRYLAEHPSDVLALSDPMSDVTALYGLMDTTNDMPRPGMLLLDIEGAVRTVYMGQSLPAEDATRIVQYALMGL